MQLCDFIRKLESWPDMNFTAIENVKRQDIHEIYAMDSTCQTLSRLLIYRTSEAQEAQDMAAACSSWLEKAGRGKRRRRHEKKQAGGLLPFRAMTAPAPELQPAG